MKSLLISIVLGCSWNVFAKPSAADFAADSFVSDSISVVVDHAKAAIKGHNEQHIVGVFPVDNGSKAKVDIFNDLPVKPL
jgi:hypothetical protein